MPAADRTDACPACERTDLTTFHTQQGIPTNSCLLVDTEQAALEFPRGDIELVLCTNCGFIFNTRFDPSLAEYSDSYEETQGFSPRFMEFANDLASSWVSRYALAGRTVLEIGCGKGEFLSLMAENGIAKGIGIDPGVDPSRIDGAGAEKCVWIADYFDSALVADRGAELEADAIVCRHTLEHIRPVGAFLDSIRSFIGDRSDIPVLFELPDTKRVLDEVAFWDIYYEHCSYFSAGSLSRLFQRHGFEVLDVSLGYDDQYLLLEALPAAAPGAGPDSIGDIGDLRAGATHFAEGFSATVESWRARLGAVRAGGGKSAIWGAGSKGVSFLGIVGDQVDAAVDINPYKHGKFMAGTGHRICSPAELVAIDPQLIVAMNPVYLAEIQQELDRLGLEGELVAL